jgi:hypothetical protein
MTDQRERFLLSFLMILVERNGGMMKIDNLSEFGNRAVSLGMEMQPGNNSVVLTTMEIDDENKKNIDWN